MNFFKALGSEILANGKLLTGYVLTLTPLTSFPGITTSVKTALIDHTVASYIDVAVQVGMVVAATLRAKKIVKAAAAAS